LPDDRRSGDDVIGESCTGLMDMTLLIAGAISLTWIVCLIICVLKGKYGMAIVGFVAGVAQQIGLPPIGGIYIFNLLYPLWLLPFVGAMRLAHSKSYYANWFYRRNLHKYWRAVERFGLIEEYAAMIAGDIEVSREFESFLRRKLTPEQRLSGLKTTEAAEVAKLTRMGMDAYVAEKTAELDPKIDAIVAEAREQQKNKKMTPKKNQKTLCARSGYAASPMCGR
jgi:hypothetical protein